MNVTRRSRMVKAVKKGQIIVVTVLSVLCFLLAVEGKPQLYSCTLKVHYIGIPMRGRIKETTRVGNLVIPQRTGWIN